MNSLVNSETVSTVSADLFLSPSCSNHNIGFDSRTPRASLTQYTTPTVALWLQPLEPKNYKGYRDDSEKSLRACPVIGSSYAPRTQQGDDVDDNCSTLHLSCNTGYCNFLHSDLAEDSPPPSPPPPPDITAIADSIGRYLSFSPDTRRHAIQLINTELGLHPGEWWDIAAAYAGEEVTQ